MQLTTWLRLVPGPPFRRAGHRTALVAAGLPLHLAVVPLWLWLLGTTAALVRAPGAVAVTPLPVLLTLVVTPLLTAGQRRRYRALVGKDLPRPAINGQSVVRRLTGRALWRQVCYHAVAGPLLAVLDLGVLAVWAAAVVAASIYVWIWALPSQWRVTDLGYTTQAAYITAGGLALLFLGPRLTGALVRLETRAAELLLGPSRTEKLARRVVDLAESRAGVLDAADAERRRIERDLHDGAQQRLVSLAVNLGLARATLGDLPEEARKVIDEAHREAKEAIAELNDLVRGLHPAVLEDRGLDAALSGVAARLPIPVRVAVDLPQRPSPTVEAVAYFVVSEALTNVVKHAQATRADVTVERIGETLLVVVADDGAGGADLAVAGDGTGLAGLAKRVASVDGTFSCRSPAGGPTVITVELPCAP
ncbi:sensor histidine kinase [Streptomyces sp. WI04-05B]|uniref:sensor histidine kinase n=1 Tax=Streptomyces TaxID=1883 RepID=UPI0029A62650|nr:MULTISPECIES: sensor histidine kinase [unclassified Streptomyces]MDX2545156.1 sensor histidine kinase [Streptomyces sp. WI04-05B]MDX2587270.1 sensor histidine kinase [Streptomyces sp. WI04-05A]